MVLIEKVQDKFDQDLEKKYSQQPKNYQESENPPKHIVVQNMNILTNKQHNVVSVPDDHSGRIQQIKYKIKYPQLC